MRVSFLGRGIRVQSGPGHIWLSATDVIKLMRWCLDHELELAAKVDEMEREQGEQPQYSSGQENGDE